MTKRNFAEERRFQLLQEHVAGLMSPEVRAVYEQNPLLEFLLNAPAKEVVAYRDKIQEEMKPFRLSRTQIRKNMLEAARKDIKYIVKRWDNGERHYDLAKDYGISMASMRKLILDFKCPASPTGMKMVEDKERTAAIGAMRDSGATFVAIAERFKLSPGRVSELYRRYRSRL